MTPKERMLVDFNCRLLSSGMSSDDATALQNVLILSLQDYDIMDACRELAVVENESEHLIKLFQGTLLTEGKSKRTANLYGKIIMRFKMFIGKKLTEINTMDVRLWLAALQNEISKSTCESYRSYLSSFYSWLLTEEFIEKNPMLKVKPIKFEDKERFPYSSTEIDAIRSVCDNVRVRAEFELMLSSGVRVEELSKLNIEDVDFQTLEVKVKCGKGGKSRKTYMNDIAAKYLKQYLETRTDDNKMLFMSNKRSRISTGALRDDLKKLGALANVENVHPHRCRRTFATNLWRRGMDIRSIQVLMGHSNINTTMRYISDDTERVGIEYRRHA